MELFEKCEPKAKRVRLNPIRMWTVEEERALVGFLQEDRNLEKLNAQSCYKRFFEKNVAVDWKQVRSKLRNMRVSYDKGKAWEGSTAAGNVEGDTIKSSLFKMCSYFDELNEIFSGGQIECTVIEESLKSGNEIFLNSTELLFDDSTTDASTLDSAPSTSFKRKGIYSRTAVSEIMQMQRKC